MWLCLLFEYPTAIEESNPAQHQLLYGRVGIGFHLQIVMNGSVWGVHEPSEYSMGYLPYLPLYRENDIEKNKNLNNTFTHIQLSE